MRLITCVFLAISATDANSQISVRICGPVAGDTLSVPRESASPLTGRIESIFAVQTRGPGVCVVGYRGTQWNWSKWISTSSAFQLLDSATTHTSPFLAEVETDFGACMDDFDAASGLSADAQLANPTLIGYTDVLLTSGDDRLESGTICKSDDHIPELNLSNFTETGTWRWTHFSRVNASSNDSRIFFLAGVRSDDSVWHDQIDGLMFVENCGMPLSATTEQSNPPEITVVIRGGDAFATGNDSAFNVAAREPIVSYSRSSNGQQLLAILRETGWPYHRRSALWLNGQIAQIEGDSVVTSEDGFQDLVEGAVDNDGNWYAIATVQVGASHRYELIKNGTKIISEYDIVPIRNVANTAVLRGQPRSLVVNGQGDWACVWRAAIGGKIVDSIVLNGSVVTYLGQTLLTDSGHVTVASVRNHKSVDLGERYALASASVVDIALLTQTTTTNSVSAADTALLLTISLASTALCDSIDFNQNEVYPEDQDVVDFFVALAGGVPTGCSVDFGCSDLDFNNNGVFPEDADVIDFFRVLAGEECP